MDSSLFSLEPDADWARRLKSRDVIRFVLGVEHERLGELALRLEELRAKKRALVDGAALLLQTLEQAGIGTKEEVGRRLAEATGRVETTEAAVAEVRGNYRSAQRHAVDDVRRRLREAVAVLREKERAMVDAGARLADEKRQRSELAILSTRFARVQQARAILADAEFTTCPRCVQALDARAPGLCTLCGKQEPAASSAEIEVASGDLRERIVEIERGITARERAIRQLRRELDEALAAKGELEQQLSRVVADYDPTALSQLVLRERDLAAAQQDVKKFRQLAQLPERVDQMRADADALGLQERSLREEIVKARALAMDRRERLEQLETLLLDCLVRSKLPGISTNDTVSIDLDDLYPIVRAGGDPLRERDFLSLSSGGKTTVFKCCFALALHRLNAATGGPLPTAIVMDTPMKNISERTNSEVFRAFYELVYELAGAELAGVQFVIIDKELCAPPKTFARPFVERLMTLDDSAHPPLIPGFKE